MIYYAEDISQLKARISQAFSETGEDHFKELRYALCNKHHLLHKKLLLANSTLSRWQQHPDGSTEGFNNALDSTEFKNLMNLISGLLYVT